MAENSVSSPDSSGVSLPSSSDSSSAGSSASSSGSPDSSSASSPSSSDSLFSRLASCLIVFLIGGIIAAIIFAYPITAVVWANFMPKIGPENLGTKVLVEGAPVVVGIALLPVLLVSLYKSLSNSTAAGLAIILIIVEIFCLILAPLLGADKPVADAISGPDVIAIKSCDNYSQTEIDRYVSRSLSGKRKTNFRYAIKFDLVTTRNEAIHFDFDIDSKNNPELYAPLVKFCKDKGTNATLKRYPRTQIVQDFIVKG
mgnify:FL=1